MGLFDLLNLFKGDQPAPRRDPRGRRRSASDSEPVLQQPRREPAPVRRDAPPPATAPSMAAPRPTTTPVAAAARQAAPTQNPGRPTVRPQRPAQPVAAPQRAPAPAAAAPAPPPRAAAAIAQAAGPQPAAPPARETRQPAQPIPLAAAQAAAQAARTPPRPRLVAENAGLQASNLGKRFKNRPVVRDVTIDVNRGEAVGLLGPNGAGKTTCFYMITGLISADYGTITLDGVDISDLPMYRRARLGIGYLPQEASIFRGLSVEQNIRSVLEVVEPRADQREVRLDELLAEFNISHLRRTPALALSGGERRRCEIARALASKPSFILLDEPLAGIDPIAVRDIRELVSHLKHRGIGVLITDHNVRETLDIVDRAYIIHEGRVLMTGKPAEIVANKDVRRVYLGDSFSL